MEVLKSEQFFHLLININSNKWITHVLLQWLFFIFSFRYSHRFAFIPKR